jgi:DnaJ-class molecular chaperone
MNRQTCPICNGAGKTACQAFSGTGVFIDSSDPIPVNLTYEMCRGTGITKCHFPGCTEGWIETRSSRAAISS